MLNIQRTQSAYFDKLSYFIYVRLWEEKGRNVAGGILDKKMFLPALKSDLLFQYITEKECSIVNCYSCNLTKEKKRQRMMKYLSQTQD